MTPPHCCWPGCPFPRHPCASHPIGHVPRNQPCHTLSPSNATAPCQRPSCPTTLVPTPSLCPTMPAPQCLGPVHHPMPRFTLALHRRCPRHPCRPHTNVVCHPRATTAGHPRASVIGHPRATAQSFIYIANLSLKFIDKHYHQCVSLIFNDNLPPFCHRNIVIICHIILSLKYFGDNLSSFYHRI